MYSLLLFFTIAPTSLHVEQTTFLYCDGYGIVPIIVQHSGDMTSVCVVSGKSLIPYMKVDTNLGLGQCLEFQAVDVAPENLLLEFSRKNERVMQIVQAFTGVRMPEEFILDLLVRTGDMAGRPGFWSEWLSDSSSCFVDDKSNDTQVRWTRQPGRFSLSGLLSLSVSSKTEHMWLLRVEPEQFGFGHEELNESELWKSTPERTRAGRSEWSGCVMRRNGDR